MASHPLLDLSAAEIAQAASLIRQLHRGEKLVFKAITLEEPSKELILEYLKAQDNGYTGPSIPRMAFAAYYIAASVRAYMLFSLDRIR